MTHHNHSMQPTAQSQDAQPAHASGWPRPAQRNGRSWNEPKHTDGSFHFQSPVNANAQGAAKSGRRAMPFKATGHKGGISFR
ncbi:hypothetical protein GFD21_01540 [Bifidobacterium sp. SMA15]|uniref:Uncharacterized protein n=1 Tax=Bifidobacterium platyrrhinorum TaxID=2661628 RepID=A0A6L9SPN6_9BIFI|nr:hypothetical protein [Bifidobacterium platyrrhinorum]